MSVRSPTGRVDDTRTTRDGLAADGGRAGPSSPWLLACRRHSVFLVVLVVGIVARILTQLAFSPALLVNESRSHLALLTHWTPSRSHPVGYGILELAPVSWFTDSLAPVVAVQHLLGLATGVVIYALLLRWGVWRWVAAAATVPVLWDPYVLAGEHLVLPDTLFIFLLAAALLVLCWTVRPSVRAAFGGGALLGTAAIVELLPLLVVAIVAAGVWFAGTTWRSRFAGALVVVLGFCIPVAPYLMWYHHGHGEFSLAGHHTDGDYGVDTWRFSSYTAPETPPVKQLVYLRHGGELLEVQRPAADALTTYQDHADVPNLLLVGGLLLAGAAAAGVGRAGSSRLRVVCLLAVVIPSGLLLAAANAGDASWRHQLPALVLLPAAGALALTALLRGRRAPSASRPQTDDVDRAALAGFRQRYGRPSFAPVVVVIAAYDEAVGLPRVLSSMPSSVRGLGADVVVVDDGSTDGTAEAANAHGGTYVVSCPVNRGQGAAMRLGYRVAREHGARYIITTDADAQYDTADFPAVLAPLLDGSADFVTGSRRLGRQHTVDRFRRAGVYVFAWIVSALTGDRVTDTSFGLRAMRAEVTAAVTLNQPQYQSSELLIGAHSHGFRIAEVPATMHLRAAGGTKKGGNLVYGMRYARVVLGTWLREGCPAPLEDHAPALRVGRSGVRDREGARLSLSR